ncbi:MAG: hypothetical protein DRO39_00955 [Thermoprotei archaeon]|nr:MAG: hypothetical protein DRO39_00955 [Thermoprotei archaeon]
MLVVVSGWWLCICFPARIPTYLSVYFSFSKSLLVALKSFRIGTRVAGVLPGPVKMAVNGPRNSG